MKKWSLVLAVLTALALIVVGCGGQAEAPKEAPKAEAKKDAAKEAPKEAPKEAAKEPLRIGVIQPLSGPVAQSGQNVLWGAEIARDEINAQGGVLGRKIELKVYDSKNDPAEAINAANKLLTSDKIKIIMGCWGSSPTLAVLPILEQAGVPIVVETASNVKVTDQGLKMVFRIAATSVQEANGVADALFKNLKIKKAAVIAVNNDWGRGGYNAYADAIKKSGGEVLPAEFVEDSATDFYPQLTKIKGSGADTIIINSEVGQIALIVKQIKELKLPQAIVSAGGSNFSDALIQLAGKEAAEGVYSAQHNVAWAPESTANPEKAKVYLEAWKKANHEWLGVSEGLRGYDGIHTIAETVKKANGSDDPKDTVPALRNLDFKSVATRVKFNEKGQSDVQMYLVKVVNGKTEVVK